MHYDVSPSLPSASDAFFAGRSAPGPAAAPRRVLIIEDEPLNRKLFRDLLSAKGYAVICAADGEDGLTACRDHAPNLVLLDVQLPGLGGAEVARAISAAPGAPPVLAISAFAGAEEAARLRAAGCVDCLPKPLAIDAFAHRVARAMDEARR